MQGSGAGGHGHRVLGPAVRRHCLLERLDPRALGDPAGFDDLADRLPLRLAHLGAGDRNPYAHAPPPDASQLCGTSSDNAVVQSVPCRSCQATRRSRPSRRLTAGFQPEQVGGLGGVGVQTEHVAGPARVQLRREVGAPGDVGDHPSQLEDRDLLTVADVDRLSDRGLPDPRGGNGARGVLDEGEVTGLAAVAEDDRGEAVLGADQELRDDLTAVALVVRARPECVERPDDHGGHAVCDVVGPGVGLAGELRAAVHGVRPGGVVLVHGHPLGSPVDLAGAAVDDPVHALVTRGLKHLEGTERVHLVVLHGLVDRVTHAQAREVVDDRRLAHGSPQSIVIEEGRLDEVDPGHALEVRDVPGGQVVEDHHRSL